MLRVARRGARSVVTHLGGQVPLAPRLLGGSGEVARIALVQTAAGLLSGDRVELEVEVGPGAALELVTTSATIAYPAREPASQALRCSVAAGGRFAWLPRPLVLTRGCELTTRLELELEAEAACLVQELVVLGRHGETPGRLEAILRCDHDGSPLLRDSVSFGPGAIASRVQLDGARAFGSTALLGLRRTGPALPGELELAGPGQLVRALAADAAELERRSQSAARAYAAALWSRAAPA